MIELKSNKFWRRSVGKHSGRDTNVARYRGSVLRSPLSMPPTESSQAYPSTEKEAEASVNIAGSLFPGMVRVTLDTFAQNVTYAGISAIPVIGHGSAYYNMPLLVSYIQQGVSKIRTCAMPANSVKYATSGLVAYDAYTTAATDLGSIPQDGSAYTFHQCSTQFNTSSATHFHLVVAESKDNLVIFTAQASSNGTGSPVTPSFVRRTISGGAEKPAIRLMNNSTTTDWEVVDVISPVDYEPDRSLPIAFIVAQVRTTGERQLVVVKFETANTNVSLTPVRVPISLEAIYCAPRTEEEQAIGAGVHVYVLTKLGGVYKAIEQVSWTVIPTELTFRRQTLDENPNGKYSLSVGANSKFSTTTTTSCTDLRNNTGTAAKVENWGLNGEGVSNERHRDSSFSGNMNLLSFDGNMWHRSQADSVQRPTLIRFPTNQARTPAGQYPVADERYIGVLSTGLFQYIYFGRGWL